jgi:chitodextrinase
MPPTAPTGLIATGARDPIRVELSWSASTDDASSIGYRVYRGGAHVGTTATTSWTNTAVAPATTYTYTVRALDAAGNLGPASAPVTVTTPSEAVEQAFAPVDDAYVRSSAPDEKTGTASTLRVRGGSTEAHTYLKFDLSGVAPVTRARLRLYVTDASTTGGSVYAGASSSWSEGTITWQTKPSATGAALATVGAVAVGQWVEWDVSALVRGPGTYTLVVRDGGSDPAWFASGETAQPPQLVVS